MASKTVQSTPNRASAAVKHEVQRGSTAHLAEDVEVHLMYLKDDRLYDSVKPMQIVPEWADREGKTNVRLQQGPLETIHDVRGRSSDFTLDVNGFQYVHAPTRFTEWHSQPAIGKEYLAELELLLRKHVAGCDEILFYDARIRQKSDEGTRVKGLSYKPFARQVHTDNTPTSVFAKIRNLTDMKADWHLSGRTRLINIWRPIKHPVYDCGLAVADGAKLVPGDVLECDRIRSDTGQYWDTMGVIKHRKGFEWHYMSKQDESDVLLFKNFDSATNVNATCCLHTAFDLPPESQPAGAPTRESIEVRAMVFTHPEGLRKPFALAPQPHPVALALEKGMLNLGDDGPIITDRLRTDIDEGSEVKDAMILLLRQQIKRLELAKTSVAQENNSLKAEVDMLQKQVREKDLHLENSARQIAIQGAHSDALTAKLLRIQRYIECDDCLTLETNQIEPISTAHPV